MRIPGSFWWVAAILTCAMATFAVVFPVYFIGSQITEGIAAGTYSSFDANSAIVFGSTIALIFVAGAIYPGKIAAQSLANFRLRRRAMNGDPDAMSLAYSPVTTGELPDLNVAPFTLYWRARRDRPLLIRALAPTLITLQAIPMFLSAGLLAWNLSLQSNKLTYIAANLFQFIAYTAGIAIIVALYIILARIYWFQAKHPFGVAATAEGLESIDMYGKRVFVPWSEACLFEIEAPSRFRLRIFRLYSGESTAQWIHQVNFSSYIPDGVSAGEMPQREAALTRVIIARTGLQPRTLSERLMEPRSEPADSMSHRQAQP